MNDVVDGIVADGIVVEDVDGGAVPFCGHCGEPAPAPHPVCAERLRLEPPRYCAQCRRRLIVQVLPTGFTARCSAHGVEIAAAARG
jgi:hypothetical protein